MLTLHPFEGAAERSGALQSDPCALVEKR
jgi:hypothetical protein